MNQKIFSTIETVLEMSSGSITIESSSENVKAWDSLGQLGILIALDKMFEGKVSKISEMALADSVKKILDLLEKNSLI